MRLAASRTFWTAGNSRPMRIAMMAMTTSSSISVNAPLRRHFDQGMTPFLDKGDEKTNTAAWSSLPERMTLGCFGHQLLEPGRIDLLDLGGVEANHPLAARALLLVEDSRGGHGLDLAEVA